uniref:Uncharacterized protein n=1 Tax=Caenorhabditis japonica TaxID=281687 RepID=A0A8R1EHR7_CAEJA
MKENKMEKKKKTALRILIRDIRGPGLQPPKELDWIKFMIYVWNDYNYELPINLWGRHVLRYYFMNGEDVDNL